MTPRDYNPETDNPDNWSTTMDQSVAEPKPTGHVERTAQSLKKAMDKFSEPCSMCRGTGSFYSYAGRYVGPCRKCKGRGQFSFKTSPEAREKTRATTQTRKAQKAIDAMDEFKQLHPDEWAWLNENSGRNEFAQSLLAALGKYHSLTERQLDAVRRNVLRRDEARAAKAAREESAPAVDLAAINEAFARASTNLKKPRLRIGRLVVSQAPANGKNAGALYIKEKTGTVTDEYDAEFNQYEYRGKVANGHFVRVQGTTDEQEAEILRLLADPKGAALSYGRKTGNCACCGRLLIVKESIERGIGPICAEQWGF